MSYFPKKDYDKHDYGKKYDKYPLTYVPGYKKDYDHDKYDHKKKSYPKKVSYKPVYKDYGKLNDVKCGYKPFTYKKDWYDGKKNKPYDYQKFGKKYDWKDAYGKKYDTLSYKHW